MAVRISITEKAAPGSPYARSFLQDRIVIGRSRLSDICLPDLTVSTRHAEIGLKGGGYTIADLGSLNGTYVNNKKLVAHRQRTLGDGDVIGIACFDLVFSSGAFDGSQEPRDVSQRQAREMLANILARTGSDESPSTLSIASGPGKGGRFILPNPPVMLRLGRNKEADIILEDRDVSRNHAEIVIDENGIELRDLESRNGIYVQGERVDSIKLEPGMQFKLGRTTISLDHPLQNSLNAIFEAPEEATSSFSIDEYAIKKNMAAEDEGQNDEEVDSSEGEELEEETEKLEPPPVGPEDPLVPSVDSPLGRTTSNMQRPDEIVNTKSDIGLIIIGAVIIVAAVLALVYLFT